MQVPNGLEKGNFRNKTFRLTDDFAGNIRLFADRIPLFVGCIRLLFGYFINGRTGHGDDACAVFGQCNVSDTLIIICERKLLPFLSIEAIYIHHGCTPDFSVFRLYHVADIPAIHVFWQPLVKVFPAFHLCIGKPYAAISIRQNGIIRCLDRTLDDAVVEILDMISRWHQTSAYFTTGE